MKASDYLASLYDYHAWATGRVLGAVARLAPADFDAAPLPGLGSLRAILVHAMSAEWIWRLRLEGHAPTAMLNPADFPALAALAERWQAEGQALRAHIDGLDEAGLAREVAYVTTSGSAGSNKVWQILMQVANHGTQHRSEAAALLTALGASPGDLDSIAFFRAQAASKP
jgi:uncharacterized damage-inducible protein DinB